MQILDLNQVLFSTLLVSISKHKIKVEEDLIRHMVLNCIRSYRSRFRDKYGELVIACDNKKYWRKEAFPYYKANRKKTRDELGLDWNLVFQAMNNVREELKTFFPYKVIDVEGAEADDVIGTLVTARAEIAPGETILILSGDKDFIQLHSEDVKQYDPVQKKWVTHANPESYLLEHIIRGDAGDGIPNIRSADNTFVLGQRQKSITERMISEFLEDIKQGTLTNELNRNFLRNKTLIDLQSVPEKVRIAILNEFRSQPDKGRSHLFNFFVKKKLVNLMEHINEF